MPTRVDIEQGEAVALLVTYLQQRLNLNDSRCYETVKPDQLPVVPSGSDYVLTVSTGPGQFTIPEQFPEQCCEESDITVMAFTRINLDPSNPDTVLLHEAKRGLFQLKKLMLKTLVGVDPQRENGEYFVRDLLHAKHALAPDIGERGGKAVITVGSIGVVFGLNFDWDLS